MESHNGMDRPRWRNTFTRKRPMPGTAKEKSSSWLWPSMKICSSRPDSSFALRIQNDTYTIEQWKVTTEWTDDGTGENLWLG